MRRDALVLVCFLCAAPEGLSKKIGRSEVDGADFDVALSLKTLAALVLSFNPGCEPFAPRPYLSALSHALHTHRGHQQLMLADGIEEKKEESTSQRFSTASPLRPNARGCSRRAALGALATMTIMPFKAWSSTYKDSDPEASANLKRPGCRMGFGRDCEKLANSSAFILDLQRQSREVKDAALAEQYDTLQIQMDMPTYFETVDKNFVKLPNGSFALFTNEEYAALKKSGRITSMGLDYLDDPSKFSGKLRVAEGPRELQDGDVLEYDEFRARLSAKQVQKVIFQPPDGMKADVLINDKKVTMVLDKKFKRQEIAGACNARGVPNNLKNLLAGGI